MNILVTLTTAGTDAGPFNLFSDANGFASAFESNVSRAALLAGFASSNAPTGTTIVKVKSVGVCKTEINLPTGITTTSTTSSSTSTTSSSTTAVPGTSISAGVATASAACSSGTGSSTVYSSCSPIRVGCFLYTNPAMTNPLIGSNLWYKVEGNAVMVDNSGQIISGQFCSV